MWAACRRGGAVVADGATHNCSAHPLIARIAFLRDMVAPVARCSVQVRLSTVVVRQQELLGSHTLLKTLTTADRC